MDPVDWISRCAERLHERWKTIAIGDLDEVACELFNDPLWRALEPEEAAVRWMQQGIPTAA
ncbi:hypothetical protein M8A51_10945 [Schlegelella sp. S2-27]|uniref:Uncharacterized protein n=1 Tax=Caldimonas mangrovi TaxID=2944811 RepID=A0ABT0YMU1_9BURK|nr:hypothetical protein [Caldimonas mangrovi]MCM5680050.1 hypothetical protein [Caldimonas mangrovi]